MQNQNRIMTAINSQAGAGQMEDEAYKRVQGFDARSYVNDVAGSAFSSFRENLGREIANIRGSQVGAGRLRTGYGTEDENNLTDRHVENLNRQVAGASMQAASIDSNMRGAELGHAEGQQNRYLELIHGQRDYETAQRNTKNERRGNMASGIGALLGAGIGMMVPGGGIAGAKLGSQIGGYAGRIFN
jgi:hypothetical protein